MILRYHKGKNFGDALNPMIFDKFLPNFFNENDNEVLIGIGSLLGFNLGNKKKYVFSTGYAAGQESTYGKLPIIDDTFDVLCVRGPLTTRFLGLSKKLAVTDGAALLRYFDFKPVPKIYEYSFMPHVGSEDFFNWKELVESIGINYISPKEDIHIVLEKIRSSKVLITEAMHGAIVADTLRVPWIPVKAYKTINDFKWQDWFSSLLMKKSLEQLPSIFSKEITDTIMRNKFSNTPKMVTNIISDIYNFAYHQKTINQAVSSFEKLKLIEPSQSNDNIFYSKSEQLLDILMKFKSSRL